jgi:hypothetical protein
MRIQEKTMNASENIVRLSAVEWAARYPDAIPGPIDRFTGNIHVGVSYRNIIRLFIERHGRRWRKLPRAERKQYLRWVMASHKANRELYRYVMQQ